MKTLSFLFFILSFPSFLLAPNLESEAIEISHIIFSDLFKKDQRATPAFKAALNLIGYNEEYFKENKKKNIQYNNYHFMNIHTYFEKNFPVNSSKIQEISHSAFFENKFSYQEALKFLEFLPQLVPSRKKEYFGQEFKSLEEEMEYCGFSISKKESELSEDQKLKTQLWVYKELCHYTYIMQKMYVELLKSVHSKNNVQKRKSIFIEKH